MKAYHSFLFLVLLGLTVGQMFGGMALVGGEILIGDAFNLENYGTPPILLMDNDIISGPAYDQQPSGHTQKPKRGTDVVLGSDVVTEGESGVKRVIYEGQHYVLENEKFILECTLNNFDQLKWTHKGKTVISGEGGYTVEELNGPPGYVKSRLAVENAHMYHGGEYKCTNFDPRSYTVYVLNGNEEGGDNILLMYEGYPLKIQCNLTRENGDLTTNGMKLDWFMNDNPITADDRIKIFHENNSLVIMTAKKEDVGDYKCQLQTEEDIKPSKEFKVIFLMVRKMEKSDNVEEKSSIALECPVEGNPLPTITWLKNNKPMTEQIANESRIYLGPNSKNVPNGTLTISNAQFTDRGNYTCNITTLVQSHERWTYLRVKGVYAALWPFIGIVIEVVILGVIIVIFEKRRAKAEFDESDTDQGNDQRNKGKDRRRK